MIWIKYRTRLVVLLSAWLVFVWLGTTQCRSKKVTPLHFIPSQVSFVAWLPKPSMMLARFAALFIPFLSDPLGQELTQLSNALKNNTQIDILRVSQWQDLGFSLEDPWAITFLDHKDLHPQKTLAILLPVLDAQKAQKNMKQWLCQWLMLDPKESIQTQESKRLAGQSVDVFSQVSSYRDLVTRYPVAAMSMLSAQVMLVTLGEEAPRVVDLWPQDVLLFETSHDGFSNFARLWKRAESDGSEALADIRVFFKNNIKHTSLHESSPNVLHDLHAIIELLKDQEELRVALSLAKQRISLETHLLHSKKITYKDLNITNNKMFPLDLSATAENPLFLARTEISLNQITPLSFYLKPFLPQELWLKLNMGLSQWSEILTGRTQTSIELSTGLNEDLKSLHGQSLRSKLEALLNMFKIKSVAQLRNTQAFDIALNKLYDTLKSQHLNVFLQRRTNPLNMQTTQELRTLGIGMQNAEIGLSSALSYAFYGAGPGAYQKITDLMNTFEASGVKQKSTPITRTLNPIFNPLCKEEISGMILDFRPFHQSFRLVVDTLFDNHQAMAHKISAKLLPSFEHLEHMGMTFEFQGPVFDAHPVLKLWLQMK